MDLWSTNNIPTPFSSLLSHLEQRLRGRGTEDEKTISTRLSNASREMEHANDYTVCIVNDNLETALSKLEEVFDDYESDGGQL